MGACLEFALMPSISQRKLFKIVFVLLLALLFITNRDEQI